METPVLYFYSPVAKDVTVHVDFPMGALSQWYPNRSGGEAFPTGSSLDFTNPERDGFIEWKATVLDPNTTEKPTQQNNIPAKWQSPAKLDLIS